MFVSSPASSSAPRGRGNRRRTLDDHRRRLDVRLSGRRDREDRTAPRRIAVGPPAPPPAIPVVALPLQFLPLQPLALELDFGQVDLVPQARDARLRLAPIGLDPDL